VSAIRVEIKITRQREAEETTTYARSDTLATFDVEADISKAFAVYQEALYRLVAPTAVIVQKPAE
jgi:methenyltetrahydromethanopterin cyclohydrolase